MSVHEYDEMRDRAYAEIARRLEAALATSPSSATSRRRWQDPDADRLPDDSAPTIITVDTSSDPPVVGGPKTSWLETILGMP